MNFNSIKQVIFLAFLTLQLSFHLSASAQKTLGAQAVMDTSIPAHMQEALKQFSAQSMREHLTFLASDSLKGRDTLFPTLDIAAEYIAKQFRSIGLEAVGDEGYFQTADWKTVTSHAFDSPSDLETIKVRNVIGVLRGSDPALKDTYVLLTAHYAHLVISDKGGEDQFFNSANDNASGTTSLIELAKVFTSLKNRPKRSIVFIAFFGKEKGLIGSTYYVNNPVFPLKKSIAGINLEQLGRTDGSESLQIASLSVTGFNLSEIGGLIKQAGEKTGINVQRHLINDERADNLSLAAYGIPSHTVSVSVGVGYGFSNYPHVKDDASKIDYENMVKVNHAIALAIATIANNPQAPQWNKYHPGGLMYWNMQKLDAVQQ